MYSHSPPSHSNGVSYLNSGDIEIKLGDWSKNTRVHVISSHFYPEYQLFDELGSLRPAGLRKFAFGKMPSIYLPQADMSDEHQYILDRQRAAKARGNMLERPTLLLSEKFVRDTTFAADPILRQGEV
jgi:ABC-type thiamine transport system ATPase subunit